ncbi:MAG: hypothetical protein MZU95_09920 [Desulfomicrobium escambiense]|nr:hypothetical protein [Desulfomicrobium escambiense]
MTERPPRRSRFAFRNPAPHREDPFPFEVIDRTGKLDREFEGFLQLGGEKAVDVVRRQAAGGEEEKGCRDEGQDDEDSHEPGPESISEDAVLSLHIKLEEVLRHEKDEDEEGEKIDAQKGNEYQSRHNAQGRQLDEIDFENRGDNDKDGCNEDCGGGPGQSHFPSLLPCT